MAKTLLNAEQMRYFGAIIKSADINNVEIALLNCATNPHKATIKSILSGYNIVFSEILESEFESQMQILEQDAYLENLLTQIKKEICVESKERDSSIQKLVYFLLQLAINARASDVHIELDMENVRVRFRIDGVLVDKFCFAMWLFAPLSASIKLLARLGLTESRRPQDGRFSLQLKNIAKETQSFDFRVSTLPLVQGESLVLRILDKCKTLIPLESLGFGEMELAQIKNLSNLPFGLVLITGPTGSGKSTTMYGILNILKHKNLKIITLEDPVEYRLEHINQVAMSKDVEFINILRNVLRQDPDVISLGEVRDKESLQLAIQAAFTGHLVFATLHTNDALDSIVRLLDMGVESHFIAQSLSGILAQRLLRKLCDCKELHDGCYMPKGCAQCNGTGYLGRIAIAEVVVASRELEQFIKGAMSKVEILEYLERKNPYFTLEGKAKLLVDRGITDEAEMYRVVKNALYC